MDFWKTFFLTDHPVLAGLWGPVVGPVVAVVSFVCSIGNVPLAAVLWNGGISFGGVVSFIFADLIVLPIINIYHKYYGWRMAPAGQRQRRTGVGTPALAPALTVPRTPGVHAGQTAALARVGGAGSIGAVHVRCRRSEHHRVG